MIDFQDVFHGGDKRRIGVGRDHPLLLAMRLENVFFSVRPIVLSRWRARQCCSSTTFSSSRRRLHLAKPSGAGEGQRDQFASAAPSKIRRRAEFELVFAGQHRLEPFLDQLAPGPSSTVAMLVSSAAAIRLSLQPSPASDMSAFNGMRAFVSSWAERLPLQNQLVESIAFLRVEPDHVFLDGNLFPGHKITSIAALPRQKFKKFPS